MSPGILFIDWMGNRSCKKYRFIRFCHGFVEVTMTSKEIVIYCVAREGKSSWGIILFIYGPIYWKQTQSTGLLLMIGITDCRPGIWKLLSPWLLHCTFWMIILNVKSVHYNKPMFLLKYNEEILMIQDN